MRAHFISLKSGGKPSKKFIKQDVSKDKFFRSPINNSLEIWEGSSDGSWQFKLIKFFNTGQERYVACAFTLEDSEGKADAPFKLMASAFQGLEFDSLVNSKFIWLNEQIYEPIKQASRFLRDSESLSHKDFEDLNKFKFVADGRGVALIDATQESLIREERGKRLQLVIALSCAYQAALNDAIDELSKVAISDKQHSETKLRQWASFLSAYYFSEPVKSSTVELIHFYEKIRDRQRIGIQYTEVTDQLRLLAELVQLDRTEQQKKQASASTWRMTATGVVIAVFGLFFTLAQITPKTINDATQSWKKCWYQSWSVCNGSEAEKISQPTNALHKKNSSLDKFKK